MEISSINNRMLEVSGINFSSRELDVISCIINGRSVKSIALLLDISTNTVNYHIKNIMSKASCFARDQIIKFVESSESHISINNRYLYLIVENEFKKLLKNISRISIDNKKRCIIQTSTGKTNEQLCNYLKMAGVNFDITQDSNINIKSDDIVHIITVFAESEIRDKSHKNTFFLLENDEIVLKRTKSDTIDNYFYAVLNCIQDIYQSDSIKNLVEDFKRYYAGKIRSNIINNSDKKWLFLNDKKLFIFISTLILAIFLLFYYSINKNQIILFNQLISQDILLPRKDLIYKLDAVFNWQKGIKFAILIGEGGSGKTVISRHYLQISNFRIKAEINAENYNNISDSFANLAIILADTEKLQKKLSYIQSITDYKMRDKQIVLFVFSQLNEKGSWCLFFDNVDNFNSIIDFIPNNSHAYNDGKVIITTRNENLKNTEMFPEYCAINVPLLTVPEQETLFHNIIYNNKQLKDEEISKMKTFLRNIPLMPLDVCAAAYYIKNTHVSFEEYLKITNNPNINSEKIHSIFLTNGINYNKTRYGIVSSVFEKIIKTNADFKELLLFICLLSSQNIPKSYLEKLKNQIIVQKFLLHLKRYSLITEKGNTFSIHKSTQEIGLEYVLSLLPENEITKFLDEIVKIMTPYDYIIWIFYKNYNSGMPLSERKLKLFHLESFLSKIELLNIKNDFYFKYKVKMLLSKLYLQEDIISPLSRKQELETVIKLNNSKYIVGYDLAVMLLEHSYLSSLCCSNFNKQYIDECIRVCDHTSDTNNIKALCYAFLGSHYFMLNDEKRAKESFKIAFNLVSQIKSNEFVRTNVYVNNQYFRSICNYYINNKEIENYIPFLIKILKMVGGEDSFHKTPEKLKVVPFFVSELRKNLAIGYSRLGQYDLALECINEVLFLYKKIGEKGVKLIMREANLKINLGYVLLMKNEISESKQVLTNAINTKLQIKDFRDLFYAFVWRSEANIQLNNLEEAYNDCQKALNFMQELKTNFNKLMEIRCYYNMYIIRYKQKNFKKSIEYFKAFFKLSTEFCHNFLEKSVHEKLLKENVFEFPKNESQIKVCLQNSLKIFSAIYGDNHSFVKNYVKVNARN